MPADGSQVSLAYVLEDSFGVPPGSPQLKLQRYVKESLKQNTSTVKSNEVVSTRDTADLIRTDLNADGDVDIEMSYGTYDDWLAAALMSPDWASPVVISAATTISFESIATSSTNYAKIKDSGSGLNVFKVGGIVKISGANTAANNAFCKIVTKAPGTLEVVVMSAANDLTDGAAGAGAAGTITLTQGGYIENGSTLRSYSIERGYPDLTTTWARFSGMMPGQFKLNVDSEGVMTGGFSFTGRRETNPGVSLDSTPTAITTTDVMNSIDNVVAVMLGDAYFDATKFNLGINNNLRPRKYIAYLGAKSVGLGEFGVDGAISTLFDSQAVYDSYINFQESSMALLIQDGVKNTYCLDLPRVKFSQGSRPGSGKNTDVVMELQYTALRDQVEQKSMRITRWPTAA